MNKTLWILIFLFIEIILEAGFNLASSFSRGLSVKNVLIYGLLVLLLLQKYTGDSKPVHRYIQSIVDTYLWLLLYSAFIVVFMIFLAPGGYDWVQGLGHYKSDFIDASLCFFIFLFFSNSLYKADKLLTLLTLIIGVCAIATVVDTVTSSIELFGLDGNFQRPNGAFGEPNQSAAVFALVLPVVFAKIITSRRAKMAYIVTAVMVLAAIACTGSRGGMLGAGFGTLLFLWYVRNRLSIEKKFVVAMVTPVLLLLAWLLIPDYHQDLMLTRLSFLTGETIDYRTASAGRTDLWALALSFWAQRPIFGWGWGSFQILVGSATHSIYFERLTDIGLIGFTIFMILQYKIWRCIINTMKASNGGFGVHFAGMAAGLMALYAALLFVNLYVPSLITGAYTGVMISYANEYRIQRIREVQANTEAITT